MSNSQPPKQLSAYAQFNDDLYASCRNRINSCKTHACCRSTPQKSHCGREVYLIGKLLHCGNLNGVPVEMGVSVSYIGGSAGEWHRRERSGEITLCGKCAGACLSWWGDVSLGGYCVWKVETNGGNSKFEELDGKCVVSVLLL